MTTYDYNADPDFGSGQIENGQVYIQLKATDHLRTLKSSPSKIAFKVSHRHIGLWRAEPFPVILVVYSVADNEAYWLYVQPYFNSPNFKAPTKPHGSATIHLSKSNVLNSTAIDAFRGYKSDVLTRIEGLKLYV